MCHSNVRQPAAAGHDDILRADGRLDRRMEPLLVSRALRFELDEEQNRIGKVLMLFTPHVAGKLGT
jgi:hypothetical protein